MTTTEKSDTKQKLNIHDYALARIKEGQTFYADLKTRTFKVGKQTLIENGRTDFDLTIYGAEDTDVIEEIKSRYRQFRHSIPSEKDSSKPSRWFKALPEDELTDEDMLYGLRRNIAQMELELYIIIQTITGRLSWDNPAFNPEHWFWQCPDDKNLIILREWIS